MATFILIGTMLMLIFIVMVMILVLFKSQMIKRDAENERRFNQLSSQINETQRLFNDQVSKLLNSVDKLLK